MQREGVREEGREGRGEDREKDRSRNKTEAAAKETHFMTNRDFKA